MIRTAFRTRLPALLPLLLLGAVQAQVGLGEGTVAAGVDGGLERLQGGDAGQGRARAGLLRALPAMRWSCG